MIQHRRHIPLILMFFLLALALDIHSAVRYGRMGVPAIPPLIFGTIAGMVLCFGSAVWITRNHINGIVPIDLGPLGFIGMAFVVFMIFAIGFLIRHGMIPSVCKMLGVVQTEICDANVSLVMLATIVTFLTALYGWGLWCEKKICNTLIYKVLRAEK